MVDRSPLVAHAMRSRIVSCTLRTPLTEVARRMHDEQVNVMLVASAGTDLIAGALTDVDLLRALRQGRSGDAMASDAMSTAGVPAIGARESLAEAAARLREPGVSVLVVTEGSEGRPVGMLARSDMVAYLAGA